MSKPKPQFVDKYLPGIDPAQRLSHRGVLRSLQFDKPEVLRSNLPGYAKVLRQVYPDGMATRSVMGDVHDDGYYYFYADEIFCLAESLQHAALVLKRNRSTLNGYCKDPTFPMRKNVDGKLCVDLIAAQDWILMNTEHHTGMEPYWPEIKNNSVVAMHVDDQFEPEPLFHLFARQQEAA